MNFELITTTQDLLEALKRGDSTRKILAAGDFELDPALLGNAELPTLILEGSGVANTRIRMGGWLKVHWGNVWRDLSVIGDDLFDMTAAPYATFDGVTFNSSVADGQSHVGKTWESVVTQGGAIRIGDDPQGRGNDNTYRISFRDCTFNFYRFPLDLRSSEWINAFELTNVVVNGAKMGLFSPSLKLFSRNTNFQCCEVGWMFAGNGSVCQNAHFERGKQDIVLGEYSYGNRIETDARTIDNLSPDSVVVPLGLPKNHIKQSQGLNMGRFNAHRKAAMLGLVAAVGL